MWIEIATLVTSIPLFILLTMDFKTAVLERTNFPRAFIIIIVASILLFLLILIFDAYIAPVPMTFPQALDIILYAVAGSVIGFIISNYLILKKGTSK